jgi:hypothetical protein
MTSDRDRKAKIRARQQAAGESYTQAARHIDHHRRPIQDLLQQATAGLRAADVTDTTAVLQAAWTGLCTIGAAGELLSICADPGHYPARWLLAEPVLADAVHTVRATPALRGATIQINPAGAPADQLDDSAASQISHRLAETADGLAATLSQAAEHAHAKAARRACRAGVAAARQVAGIYRAGKTVRPDRAEAVTHPEWLQAHTREELQQIIDGHRDQLQAADPADTAAALTAAWYGFAVAVTLGQFLASRDPDDAVAHRNALPVIVRIVEVLQAAPSMPTGIHGVGLDTTPAADPGMMLAARRGIWDLTLAINTLLPKVAEQAGQEADLAAARAGTMLAAELNDCYVGRLRTFLNPYGRTPGSKSLVIRSKGPARKAKPHTGEPPGLTGGYGPG